MSIPRQTQILENSLSNSKDALISTTYEDDYTARGLKYVIANTFTITAGATANFLLDLSGMPAGKTVFSLPLTILSSAEEVQIRIYEGTDYAGGTVATCYNSNRMATDTYDFMITTGATGTDKGTLFKNYVAYGSSGFFGSTATGKGYGSSATILNPTKKYLLELENMGAGDTNVSYIANLFQVDA